MVCAFLARFFSGAPSSSSGLLPPHLRFPILKTRCVSGIDTLILRGTAGATFCVPREWTDRDVPATTADLASGAHVLDFVKLIALTELLAALEQADDRGLQK